MDTLLFLNLKPKSIISSHAIPKPTQEALKSIYSDVKQGLWLVGGSAISGFYAEHRRSDDLDLFAADPHIFRAATLAVKALKRQGAQLKHEMSSAHYYHVESEMNEHRFTIDVVLDEHLHQEGKATLTKDGIWVADLDTLFAMKIACLVSRCSEKDLYDLVWFFENIKGKWTVKDLIEKGKRFDGGISVETLLINLQGTYLKKEACHFLLKDSKTTVDEVFQKITRLQESLIQKLLSYEKSQTMTDEVKALAESFRDQKKFRK